MHSIFVIFFFFTIAFCLPRSEEFSELQPRGSLWDVCLDTLRTQTVLQANLDVAGGIVSGPRYSSTHLAPAPPERTIPYRQWGPDNDHRIDYRSWRSDGDGRTYSAYVEIFIHAPIRLEATFWSAIYVGEEPTRTHHHSISAQNGRSFIFKLDGLDEGTTRVFKFDGEVRNL
ncbi:hypothetical protein IAQ61_003709 [Plenodomus lingam]|uniref:uncharacterized protein n=1 Tax=Leptosphaeria maculans TaxID=5022 RepID=UPI00333097FE|nr:hypothetical protein IAQ61_003709 [Plenodomus lingam]